MAGRTVPFVETPRRCPELADPDEAEDAAEVMVLLAVALLEAGAWVVVGAAVEEGVCCSVVEDDWGWLPPLFPPPPPPESDPSLYHQST